MSPREPRNEYWTTFWNTSPIVEIQNPHSQVGRTVNRVPIDPRKWEFHLNEIERVLELNASDTLLDLCSGNGLIATPFSQKCRSVTAVDISNALLAKIDTKLFPQITVISGDVRDVRLPAEAFSKGVMYGALQYFTEKEAIGIFETAYRSLTLGGKFLIGDIPDIDQLFAFYNKPEWVKAYFDSIRSRTPAIGNWFKKEVLVGMGKYVGFGKAEILIQHPDLINSHYRFDVLLTK